MKIIMGIDVGIEHLSYCIINKEQYLQFAAGTTTDPGILDWNIISALAEKRTCCGRFKNEKLCTSLATRVDAGNYYCGRHCTPTSMIYKHPLATNVSINKIRKTFFEYFDQLDLLDSVTCIRIETQFRANQKMRTVASSLASYFVIRQCIDKKLKCTIKNSPATKKLRMYTGPEIVCTHLKNEYAKRKFLAIEQTKWFLKSSPTVLAKYFNDHSKKDDLADAFLHAILDI